MTDETTPKTFEEYKLLLGDEINSISKDLWAYLHNRALSINQTVDQPGLNCIMAAVCSNIFAHYNALVFVDGVETREHVEKAMLKIFNENYKYALPKLIEQFQGKAKSK